MLSFVNIDYDKLQNVLDRLEEEHFLRFKEQDELYFFLAKTILRWASNYRCAFGGHDSIWVQGVKGLVGCYHSWNKNVKGTVTIDFNKLQVMIEKLKINGSIEVNHDDIAYLYLLHTIAKFSGYKYLLDGQHHLKIVGLR